MLHICVELGEQLPCAEQVPLDCQAPALQNWMSLPQLPQATGCVCPGAQMPVHVAPLLLVVHVELLQATGVPHDPLELHVEMPLFVHCVVPGVHVPPHAVPVQALAQVVGDPHWPQPSQVSICVLLVHCVAPGVQAGVAAPHEHVPHAQADVQDCFPYVLHACDELGAHAPWPEQVPPDCHAPLALHVWVSVPQLPHATGLVWPGAHAPVHEAAPPLTTQVLFVQVAGVPH